MRKTLRAFVLMLALCAPAAAGVISNPSSPQPATRVTAEEPTADGFTEAVLSLLESVLALF